MSGQPLVAAVMVTGKSPSRRSMALAAVESFNTQTYPNKQLIVINDGQTLGLRYPGYEEHMQRRQGDHTGPSLPLGELRNAGLVAARNCGADFVIQWDDDDFYHPNRITYQVAGSAAGYCTLLKHQIRYDVINNNAFNFCWDYAPCLGIPGTILYPLHDGLKYPSEKKGEDETFIQNHFPDRCVVLNNAVMPQMYIRLVHDTNTWDRYHIMQKMPEFATARDTWLLTREQASFLGSVLSKYYHLDRAVSAAVIHEPVNA